MVARRAMTLLFGVKGLAAKGIDVHPVTIWRWVHAGSFPKPIKVGSRNAWVEAEVDDYIARQIEQRDSKSSPASNASK